MWIAFGIICMLVGFFAYKKFNRNFWIWSFIAFLISPLFTIIILLILEYIINMSPEKFSRKMMDLHKLYKNGIISDEEYQLKKDSLINSIRVSDKENFLVKILPLVENGVLTNEDIEKIKRRFNGRTN
jgi:biotin transporter BioY